MERKKIAGVMVFVVVMLFIAFMAGAFQPLELEPEIYEVGLVARSPWWYKNYCDYLRLEIADHVPDGIYVNCNESSTKSPGALEQFESVWGAAIEATKPAPDTWEHWFPTVPKPENTPTAFELLAQKVFDFGRKVLAAYREGQ